MGRISLAATSEQDLKMTHIPFDQRLKYLHRNRHHICIPWCKDIQPSPNLCTYGPQLLDALLHLLMKLQKQARLSSIRCLS